MHSRTSDAAGSDSDRSSKRQKRVRSTIACKFCSQKKIKCDGNHPCNNCKGRSIQCVYPTPRKRGPKTGAIRGLQAEVEKLQAQLVQARAETQRAKSLAAGRPAPSGTNEADCVDCKRCCKTAQACGAKDVQFSSFLQDIERVHVPENPAAPGSWMTDKLDPDTVHRECRFIRAFFVWINPVMPMICPNLFSRIMLRLKLRQHAREIEAFVALQVRAGYSRADALRMYVDQGMNGCDSTASAGPTEPGTFGHGAGMNLPFDHASAIEGMLSLQHAAEATRTAPGTMSMTAAVTANSHGASSAPSDAPAGQSALPRSATLPLPMFDKSSNGISASYLCLYGVLAIGARYTGNLQAAERYAAIARQHACFCFDSACTEAVSGLLLLGRYRAGICDWSGGSACVSLSRRLARYVNIDALRLPAATTALTTPTAGNSLGTVLSGTANPRHSSAVAELEQIPATVVYSIESLEVITGGVNCGLLDQVDALRRVEAAARSTESQPQRFWEIVKYIVPCLRHSGDDGWFKDREQVLRDLLDLAEEAVLKGQLGGQEFQAGFMAFVHASRAVVAFSTSRIRDSERAADLVFEWVDSPHTESSHPITTCALGMLVPLFQRARAPEKALRMLMWLERVARVWPLAEFMAMKARVLLALPRIPQQGVLSIAGPNPILLHDPETTQSQSQASKPGDVAGPQGMGSAPPQGYQLNGAAVGGVSAATAGPGAPDSPWFGSPTPPVSVAGTMPNMGYEHAVSAANTPNGQPNLSIRAPVTRPPDLGWSMGGGMSMGMSGGMNMTGMPGQDGLSPTLGGLLTPWLGSPDARFLRGDFTPTSPGLP